MAAMKPYLLATLGGADAFHGTVNRVQPGYIRTESDEVHYNLHVMLRFDLERQLLAGDLAPDALEEAWNARFLQDFGVAVDNAEIMDSGR